MAQDDDLTPLQSIPLFSEIGTRDLKRLVAAGRRRSYRPREEIVREGARGVGLFVILEGEVEVRSGGRHVADLAAGTYFGELSLFEDVPRNGTIVAKTPVECLAWTRWDFLAELRGEPTMALQMLATTMRRLRDTTQKLAEAGGQPDPTQWLV